MIERFYQSLYFALHITAESLAFLRLDKRKSLLIEKISMVAQVFYARSFNTFTYYVVIISQGMSMSVVVSFRISRELKRKMDMLSYINWSEVVRKAIEEVVNKELSKLKSKDVEKLKMAALRSEEFSRKVEGWNSVEEIRRWREKR